MESIVHLLNQYKLIYIFKVPALEPSIVCAN